MIHIADQAGRLITISEPPARLVSVVPSITELLYHLGLHQETVGITKFCVHPPEWFSSKKRVGGTKNLDLNAIAHLEPQLLIASKEENVKTQIDQLEAICPVYLSDVKTLEDALQMIQDIGFLVGRQSAANEMVAEISAAFENLKRPEEPLNCCYLIWQKPFMAVGGDTFISNMLQHAGFKNVFANQLRYPQISLHELIFSGCQYLFLSTEPFPFTKKHLLEIESRLELLSAQTGIESPRIVLVDGEFFSWYGSRLLKAPAYFSKLLMSLISM